jgi:hypothetical protein
LTLMSCSVDGVESLMAAPLGCAVSSSIITGHNWKQSP